MTACPCGGASYQTCCSPLHAGAAAPTAEALMRSRYAAFVMGNGEYLEATRLGERRFGAHADLAEWSKKVGWLGLKVNTVVNGGADDEVGRVAFEARYIDDGQLVQLSEDSEFRRQAGTWKYVEGEATEKRQRLQRNESCPCGSGKKFKQCHL